ncbi:hypothetical protein AKJ49_00360, partial [candidate division MSBL1 archaeon SCGC-AAA382A03]
GSGIIDGTAEMLKTGILQPDGAFNKNKQSERIRKSKEDVLEYVLEWKDNTAVDIDITITQKDIREVQKAKGAIQAAARIMMDELNVEKIDQVFLAGAFGNYIDKESGRTIGLFPECDLDKVEPLGNAAGEGAKLALIDKEKMKEADKIPDLIKFIEIAGTEEFKNHYMETLYLPHRNLDLYPQTRKKLKL